MCRGKKKKKKKFNDTNPSLTHKRLLPCGCRNRTCTAPQLGETNGDKRCVVIYDWIFTAWHRFLFLFCFCFASHKRTPKEKIRPPPFGLLMCSEIGSLSKQEPLLKDDTCCFSNGVSCLCIIIQTDPHLRRRNEALSGCRSKSKWMRQIFCFSSPFSVPSLITFRANFGNTNQTQKTPERLWSMNINCAANWQAWQPVEGKGGMKGC